jgi:hypothetical protein
MATINLHEVHGQMATAIEHSLAFDCGDKLQTLTCEEMFYLKKVLDYQVKPGREPSQFRVLIKARAMRWLHGQSFESLARYWQAEYLEFVGNDYD